MNLTKINLDFHLACVSRVCAAERGLAVKSRVCARNRSLGKLHKKKEVGSITLHSIGSWNKFFFSHSFFLLLTLSSLAARLCCTRLLFTMITSVRVHKRRAWQFSSSAARFFFGKKCPFTFEEGELLATANFVHRSGSWIIHILYVKISAKVSHFIQFSSQMVFLRIKKNAAM